MLPPASLSRSLRRMVDPDDTDKPTCFIAMPVTTTDEHAKEYCRRHNWNRSAGRPTPTPR